MKQILMVLAPENFRDIEYLVPRAFFEQQNAKVTTTSTQNIARGTFHYEVKVDILLEEAPAQNFDGIFFVGGGGSLLYEHNGRAQELTRSFIQEEKPVGAICAAPRNLLAWGFLKEKHCTGHNWDNQFPSLCEKHGAFYSNEDVVTDGNIITANGPGASEACALAFLKLLNA